MNSHLSRLLAGAAKQAEALMGESFTLGGATYHGTVRNDPPQFIPGPNGIQRQESLTIVATKAQFATAPTAAPRMAATIGGSAYWLTSVDDDDLHYFLGFVPA